MTAHAQGSYSDKVSYRKSGKKLRVQMLIHAFRPNHGSSDTEHPSSTIYGRRPMHYRMCCFSSADKSQLSLAITQVEKSCV